jgi:hypothetical protein
VNASTSLIKSSPKYIFIGRFDCIAVVHVSRYFAERKEILSRESARASQAGP